MKKLISMLAVLSMGCVFAVSAMAAGTEEASLTTQVDMSHVYISDATIEVGETYTWYYDGEAGSVDYGEQGTALKIVSGTPNDQGGMTFVYEGVEPGTHTFRIVDRWWMETYKMVTVTVEEASSGAEPENPAEEPETSNENQAPAEEDQTAAPGSTESAAAAAPVYEDNGLAEAIANGTWGAEYTTCPACGYHNWTAGPEGYVCDTCGYITTWVKTASGVKGYVGAQMPVQPAAAAAPAVTRQSVAEAQDANAAYLAAIRALQAQVAQREAAYLAALKG